MSAIHAVAVERWELCHGAQDRRRSRRHQDRDRRLRRNRLRRSARTHPGAQGRLPRDSARDRRSDSRRRGPARPLRLDRHRHSGNPLARDRPGQERQLGLADRPGRGRRSRGLALPAGAPCQRRQLLRPVGSDRRRGGRVRPRLRGDSRHRRRRRRRGRRPGADGRQRGRRRMGPQPPARHVSRRMAGSRLLLRPTRLYRNLPVGARPRGGPCACHGASPDGGGDRGPGPRAETRPRPPRSTAMPTASPAPSARSSTFSIPRSSSWGAASPT